MYGLLATLSFARQPTGTRALLVRPKLSCGVHPITAFSSLLPVNVWTFGFCRKAPGPAEGCWASWARVPPGGRRFLLSRIEIEAVPYPGPEEFGGLMCPAGCRSVPAGSPPADRGLAAAGKPLGIFERKLRLPAGLLRTFLAGRY